MYPSLASLTRLMTSKMSSGVYDVYTPKRYLSIFISIGDYGEQRSCFSKNVRNQTHILQ